MGLLLLLHRCFCQEVAQVPLTMENSALTYACVYVIMQVNKRPLIPDVTEIHFSFKNEPFFSSNLPVWKVDHHPSVAWYVLFLITLTYTGFGPCIFVSCIWKWMKHVYVTLLVDHSLLFHAIIAVPGIWHLISILFSWLMHLGPADHSAFTLNMKHFLLHRCMWCFHWTKLGLSFKHSGIL